MSKSKSNIVFILFFVLLLVGAIGVLFVFLGGVDGVKDMLDPTFRVKCNDNVYTVDGDNLLILPDEGQVRFDVVGASSYTIKVEPNTDFNYTADEQTFAFGDEVYTEYFVTSESVYNDCFVLDCDKDYSAESVLSCVRNEIVQVPEDIYLFAFKFVITSGVGKIEIPFWQNNTSITLSQSTIVF